MRRDPPSITPGHETDAAGSIAGSARFGHERALYRALMTVPPPIRTRPARRVEPAARRWSVAAARRRGRLPGARVRPGPRRLSRERLRPSADELPPAGRLPRAGLPGTAETGHQRLRHRRPDLRHHRRRPAGVRLRLHRAQPDQAHRSERARPRARRDHPVRDVDDRHHLGDHPCHQTAPKRDNGGAVTQGGDISATALRVGDCIDNLKDTTTFSRCPVCPAPSRTRARCSRCSTFRGRLPGGTTVENQVAEECNTRSPPTAPAPPTTPRSACSASTRWGELEPRRPRGGVPRDGHLGHHDGFDQGPVTSPGPSHFAPLAITSHPAVGVRSAEGCEVGSTQRFAASAPVDCASRAWRASRPSSRP